MEKQQTPRQKYSSHKSNAKRRGLEFDFTFEEWWEIWEPHIHNRGTEPGQLQMCRTRDEGGYTPGNVRIDTVESNRAELVQTHQRRVMQRAWGDNNASDWLAQRGMYGRDYFWMKRQEEKRLEQGLDEDD